MNLLFAYLIKSSISLALLYCLFRFTMRNNITHSLNRFLLLGILLMSAIIPFLNIQFFYEEVPLKQVEVFREFVTAPVFTESIPLESIQPEMVSTGFLINWWLLVYLSVIVLMLIRIVTGIFKVTQIIKRAEKRRLQKIVLALVKDLIQPFTFLNKVVISEKDFTENKDIIVAHEHAHIKHLHALDLMVCEVFTVMHFFNPFMWLLRRDLKLIHEYQADEAVLNIGIDAKTYQLLVLQKSVGERRFAMANHFTQKPILKRLKMMQKKNRKKWAALKLILFLPLLVILLQAFARPELITKSEDFIPVKYTENKAEKWLSKWTADNIGKGFYEPDLIEKDAPRKPNNVLVILMNAKDEYLIEGEHHPNADIKKVVKDYLHGINPDGKNGPDFIETEIPEIGKVKVSKGLISYRYDIDSSKEMVDKTMRAIGEACLEVRDEKAKLFFDENFFELSSEKREAIEKAVPVWFTTENPKGPSPSVWLPFDGKPSPEPEPIQIKVKSNGEVFAENHKYNSYESFKENVKEWKADLDKYNEKRKSKAFYRAHVTFEAEVPRAEQKAFDLFLNQNSVHVEWIKEEEVKVLPLQTDKLKERASQENNDSDVELSIPEGFSPNNDGIHDYFIIKGIYPKYPDAKLLVFSENGEKLYEQEHYGNTNVWGKDKVWWSGSSDKNSLVESDGKLPAGNYKYVLELGNGEEKSGKILLAKSPPPRVLEVLPANPSYDEMPVIRFGEESLNVNGKRCDISDLKNVLEDLLPNDGSQRKVKLIVYSITSKERVEQIYAELQNIDDLEIIRKDLTPPPPPPPLFRVKMYENRITIWDYTIKTAPEDVQNSEVAKKAKEFLKRAGENYIVSIFAYENVSEDRIDQMKELLGKTGMKNIKVRKM